VIHSIQAQSLLIGHFKFKLKPCSLTQKINYIPMLYQFLIINLFIVHELRMNTEQGDLKSI